MSHQKFFVASAVALAIGFSPLASRGDSVFEMADQAAIQAKTSASETLAKVQQQSDVQTAKLMAQYGATALVITHLKQAHIMGESISRIQDSQARALARTTVYAVPLAGVLGGAWYSLYKIGTLPKLIRMNPGFFSGSKMVAGAAIKIALMGGVVYSVWKTNDYILLDQQDYNELLMSLQADLANLELQLPANVKAKLNAQTPGVVSTTPAADSGDMFKIE